MKAMRSLDDTASDLYNAKEENCCPFLKTDYRDIEVDSIPVVFFARENTTSISTR
jgi:hypothetical protein